MAITLVSSRAAGNATQELKRLTDEFDLGDTEELIAKGRPVRSGAIKRVTSNAIDLSDLGAADYFDDSEDLDLDGLLLDGETLDEDDLTYPDSEDESAVQEALVTLLGAYVELVPSASNAQLVHLAAALGMTDEESTAFVQLAESMMRPEGDLLGDYGATSDVEEDAPNFFNAVMGKRETAEVAEENDEGWEDASDDTFGEEDGIDPDIDDALEDNNFTLDVDDLDALTQDVELPVTASFVTATDEQDEFKEDLIDDGYPGPDDPSGEKQALADDGEPTFLIKNDHELTDNDGEPEPRA